MTNEQRIILQNQQLIEIGKQQLRNQVVIMNWLNVEDSDLYCQIGIKETEDLIDKIKP